jgi:hypothetical protein
MNLYGFVGNAGVNSWDNFGLDRTITGTLQWALQIDDCRIVNGKYVRKGIVQFEFVPKSYACALGSIFWGFNEGDILDYTLVGETIEKNNDTLSSSPCQDLAAIAEIRSQKGRIYQLFSSNCQGFAVDFYDSGMNQPKEGKCCNPDGTKWKR